MTFDAGAIEATLKLNRDQFDEELDAAEQRARDFEGKSYSAKLKVETGEADADLTSTEALYEALRENLSRSIHIDVKADTAKADAELEVTSLEADKLERKRINIGSWFGGGGGIGNIISQIGGLGDAFGKMGSNISEGETVATPLFSGIIGAAPVAVAALAPLVAITGGLAAGLVGAGASIGSVGIIAIPLMSKMMQDYQALGRAQSQYAAATTSAQRQSALQAEARATSNLTGSEKGLFAQLQGIQRVYSHLQSEFAKPLANALTPWFTVVKSLLGDLPLFLRPALGVVKSLGEVISGVVQSPDFKAFLAQLGQFGAFALQEFGAAGIQIAHAFANLLIAFMPVARVVLPGMVDLAGAFERWTEGLTKSSGFHQFIAYAMANAPALGKLLLDLLIIFVKLMVAMAPLGAVMLKLLEVFVAFLAKLTPKEMLAIIAVIGLLGIALAVAFEGIPLLISLVVAAIVGLAGLLIDFWPSIRRVWDTSIRWLERDVVDKVRDWFENSLPNAFNHFVNFWKRGWHDVQNAAGDAWRFLTHGWGQVLIPGLTAIRLAVEFFRGGWRTVWRDVQNIAADAWHAIYQNTWVPFINVVTKVVPSAFDSGKKAVARAWADLGNVVKSPVNWVIAHVINGLINAFDWVSSKVGGPSIKPVAQLATGGRIPGYGGGDRHIALLEAGEAVVSKETTAANAATLAAWGVPGFQSGGRAGHIPQRSGNPPSHPSGIGGFLSGIGHAISGAFDEAVNVGKAVAAIGTGNTAALVNAMKGMIPGGTHGAVADMAELLTDLPARLLADAVKDLLGLGGLGASGSAIVQYAMSFLGKIPYTWGGTSLTGCDCSGFTGAIYHHFGIHAPRTSEAQGAWVKRTGPVPGGLAFYISAGGGPSPGHVAIVKDAGHVISQGGGMGPIVMPIHDMPLMFTGVPPGGLGSYSAGAGKGGWWSMSGLPGLWGRHGGGNAHVAGAVAMAESGGDPHVIQSGEPPGLTGYGLWQITPTSGIWNNGQFGNLLNPDNNASAGVYLWRGAGNSFRPWATYNSGAYQRFMDNGGWLGTGTSIVTNKTGSAEAVTPAHHMAAMSGAIREMHGEIEAMHDNVTRLLEWLPDAVGASLGDTLNGIGGAAMRRAQYGAR